MSFAPHLFRLRRGSRLAGVIIVLGMIAASSAAADLFPAAVLQQFQTDLGVTLDATAQADLYAIVYPATVDAWRTAAEARIDQNRKANLALNIIDVDGQPLIGASIEIRQKSRPFKFGGILDLKMLNGVSTVQPVVSVANYKARALALFDAFGLNNGFKPRQMGLVTDPNANQNLLPGFLSWAASAGRPVRGHLLIWPGLDHLSATVDAKTSEIEALVALRNAATDPQVIADYNSQIEAKKPELRSLVDAEITNWATRWSVTEWDVINEAISNTRLQAILGDAEMVRWFQLAQAAQPAAGRAINEFQIISGNSGTTGTGGQARIDTYKGIINGLIAGGAPITGINFQTRFGFKREDPALLYSRLEQFVPYGLTLTGTEFEVVDRPTNNFIPTEQLRAQITEEVMTTYFSHPSVKGLYVWTYIMPNATEALLDTNGVPKLNGLVWYYLNRIRYTTRTTANANLNGSVSLRAFKGDYDVVIRYAGSEVTRTLSLAADTQQTFSTPFVSNQLTRTIATSADTFVRRDQPAGNFGTFPFLDLRRSSDTAGRFVYLRFELAAATGDITSARLRVKIPSTSVSPTPETDLINVYAADATAWTETGLTWDNRPALGPLLATGQGAADTWLEFTLPASAIPAAGGTVTLVLDEQASSYGRLQSREAGFAPTLTIVESLDHDGDGVPDSVDPDDDNDGISDDWELAHGLAPRDASDALLDPDGDGRPNLLEYLLGRDPLLAEPLNADLELRTGTTGYHLKWRRRAAEASPAVSFSTDLATWQTLRTPADFTAAGIAVQTVVITPDGAAYETVELDFQGPAGGSRIFFRLQP